MAATVYFTDVLPGVGDVGVLDGPEGRHAATVRRTTVGERLVLADGAGSTARVEVTASGKDRLDYVVLGRSVVPAPHPAVTLIQALPKSERSELTVENATEAGVDAIVPWQSVRCVARWDGPRAAKGVAKWRNAAQTAAKQSRRAYVPTVADVADTRTVVAETVATVRRGGLVVALHESAQVPFASLPFATAESVTLIVGPEGGLDDREVEALVAAGAVTAVLGPTVLRTSTAAAVALGALGVLTDRWKDLPPSANELAKLEERPETRSSDTESSDTESSDTESRP